MTTRISGSTDNVLSKHISTMTVALTKDLSAYDNVVIVKPNNTDSLYAKYKKTTTGGTASVLTDLGFNDLEGNVFQIIISTELTPMHFGAIGDGTTNDGVALNKAFKSGADIHLPSDRTFNYQGSLDIISNNINVRGRGKLICSSITGLNATGDLVKISGTDVLFDNVVIEDNVNSSAVNRTINIAGARFKIRDSVLIGTYKYGIGIVSGVAATDYAIENVEYRNSRSTSGRNFYNESSSAVRGRISRGVHDRGIQSVAPASGSVINALVVENIKMDIGQTGVTGFSGTFSKISGCDIRTNYTTNLFSSSLPYVFSNNSIIADNAGTMSCYTNISGNYFTVNTMSISSGACNNNTFVMWTNNSSGYTVNTIGTTFSGNTFLATTTGALVTFSPTSENLIVSGNNAYGTITNFIDNTSAGSGVVLVSNYKNGSLES